MNVIYDSTTEFTAIQSKDCTTCQGNTYDIEQSRNAVRTGARAERTYGNTKLSGEIVSDRMCPQISTCATMSWLYVDKVEGESDKNVDGVIGLAKPDKEMKLAPAATPPSNKQNFFLKEGGPSFGSNTWTLNIANSDTISWIKFGGEDI